MSETQNYSNHTRFNPLFHFVVIPLLLVNMIWSFYQFYKLQSWDSAENILLALTLILLALAARLHGLRVQDRVIRLEEEIRYGRVLNSDLQERSRSLKLGQIIALRFASDEELPGMVERTLKGEFEKNNDIKKAVTNWRGDHLRV